MRSPSAPTPTSAPRPSSSSAPRAAASATCRCSRSGGCWAASGSPSPAPGATPAAPPPPRWTRAITTCSTARRSSSPMRASARSSRSPRAPSPAAATRGITSFIVTKDTVDLEQGPCGSAWVTRRTSRRPAASGRGRRRTRWAGAPATRASSSSRTRWCPRRTSWAQVGQGFINFLKTLDAGRIGIAALSLGIAEGAYDEALRYAGVRKQFGRLIGSFQGVSFQLADMALEIEAGTHLLYHAAWLKQNGRPFKKEAAMAKLFCSELAMRAHDEGRPDLRRLRLHHRVPRRADDARRQGLRDRRGHQRDPADGDRSPDPGAGGGLSCPNPYRDI